MNSYKHEGKMRSLASQRAEIRVIICTQSQLTTNPKQGKSLWHMGAYAPASGKNILTCHMSKIPNKSLVHTIFCGLCKKDKNMYCAFLAPNFVFFTHDTKKIGFP